MTPLEASFFLVSLARASGFFAALSSSSGFFCHPVLVELVDLGSHQPGMRLVGRFYPP